MKKYFISFGLAFILCFSVFSFTDKPSEISGRVRIIDGKAYIVSIEMIRVTSAGDLASVPETAADLLLCIDFAGTVANGTLEFPVSPINGQQIMVTTRSQITTVTLDAGAIPISGPISTLAAGANVGWVYNQAANRWFSNN